MFNLLVDVKKFTISEGLLYALVGFCLVIVVLFFLMLVIKALSAVVTKLGKKQAKAVEPVAESAPALAPGRSGEIKLFDVPDKEAAMLMAIVADKMQTPLNELRFKSIKKID